MGDLVELERGVADGVATRDSSEHRLRGGLTQVKSSVCRPVPGCRGGSQLSDLTAELTLVDHMPAVYAAETLPMPAFVSGQIPTIPPAPPVIANVRSDVTVMTR